MTMEGATNTEVFRAYVKEVLLPSLRPGDIVVMDKNEQTLRLIREAGAAVKFFPAYSPDLNPIELMWGKVKAFLRAAEARSKQQLFSAIGQALRTITAQDTLNWFAHCGYNFI